MLVRSSPSALPPEASRTPLKRPHTSSIPQRQAESVSDSPAWHQSPAGSHSIKEESRGEMAACTAVFWKDWAAAAGRPAYVLPDCIQGKKRGASGRLSHRRRSKMSASDLLLLTSCWGLCAGGFPILKLHHLQKDKQPKILHKCRILKNDTSELMYKTGTLTDLEN